MDDSSFDPYYRWLAIPPADQPPNCYRLLGVALFEADLDVIASAADRQMGHLRTYQNGPYSHYSQRLLNEVSQARLMLLQPLAKAQYDRALRAHLYPATPPTPPTALPANVAPLAGPKPPASPVPTPVVSNSASVGSHSSIEPTPNTASRFKRPASSGVRQFIGIVLGGLAGCFLGAVILSIAGVDLPGGFRLFSRREEPEPPTESPLTTERSDPTIADSVSEPEASSESTNATKLAFSQIAADIDPWGNSSLEHFLFTPATYSLKYAERGERAYFDIYRQASSSNQRAGSLGLADCLHRDATIQHAFDRQLGYHFYYVKPHTQGKVVLRLNAASDALFDGPGEICLLGWVAGSSPDHRLTLAAYRDFDLATMAPLPSSPPLAEQEFRSTSRDNQAQNTNLICTLKFVARQQPELFIVLGLDGGAGGGTMAAQWKLHNEVPSHYRTQGATTVRFTTIPRPAGFAAHSNDHNRVSVTSPIALTSLPTPEEFERLLQLHEQRHTSADPQTWLTLAQVASGSADRKALFMLAARRAASQGNLPLFEQIFAQFQQETRDDLATLKLPLLIALAAAPTKEYSPAAFARVAYDVLQKQPLTAANVETGELIALAKAAAKEAGDLRLQQALTRLERAGPITSSTPSASSNVVPLDETRLNEARAVVKDLFAKDLEKADTAEKRRQIAGKMQALAYNTRDDAAARYILLHEAATLLTRFDSPDAWEAWEQLTKEFGAPVLNEKMSALDALQKKARQSTEYRILANRYLALLNAAIQTEAYREAELAGARAETTAKKANDKLLERIVVRRSKDIAVLKKAFESARASRDVLQSQPGDTTAALAWGRYLCMYRGQWQEGLPLLAQGNEVALANLAKRDLASATDVTEQTAIGDAWWDLAEQQAEERPQQQLRARAVYWYQLALPQLAGLPAAKVTQRVEALASETSPYPLNVAGDVLAMVDVAAHASTAEWGRQGSVIGVSPRNGRGENRLVIPIAIHGSYEIQTKIEWQSRFYGQIQLELPVGDRLVVVDVGRTPALRTNDAADKVRIDHPAADLQNGKIYQLGAKVTQDGNKVLVQATLNGRPYVSWSGTIDQCLEVSDVRRPTFAIRQPNQNIDETAFRKATLGMVGGPADAFAIGTFQLQLLSGWAEPITR